MLIKSKKPFLGNNRHIPNVFLFLLSRQKYHLKILKTSALSDFRHIEEDTRSLKADGLRPKKALKLREAQIKCRQDRKALKGKSAQNLSLSQNIAGIQKIRFYRRSFLDFRRKLRPNRHKKTPALNRSRSFAAQIIFAP